MITDAILGVLFGLARMALGLLPGIPAVDFGGLANIGPYLVSIDYYVDIQAWASVTGIMIAVEGGLGVLRLANWVRSWL